MRKGGRGRPGGGRRELPADPIFLDPTEDRFERTPGGILRLHRADRCHCRVTVRCAFPFSQPDRYLSVADADGEVGLLRDLAALEPTQRELVEAALARHYFQPVIQTVRRIHHAGGDLAWEVVTDHGPVSFTARHPRHSVTPLDDGRYLLTDSERNRYLIPRLGTVDPRSRRILLDLLS